MSGTRRANTVCPAALFGGLADCLDGAVRQFFAMLNENRFGDEDLGQLREIERRCDEATCGVLDRYDEKAFFPLRMENAHFLALRVDDVVDALFSVSKRIAVYELGGGGLEILRFGKLIFDSCAYIAHALRGLDGHAREDILPLLNEVYKRDSEGASLLDASYRVIFKGTDDALTIIKRKDIVEGMDRVLNMCKSAAHAIDAITLNIYRRKKFLRRWSLWGA